MAQQLVTHREHARRGAQCAIVVAHSQHAEDESRCRDLLRERHNAHAARDGQDRGVVTRSVDRSASVRQCESSASKSVAIRPIRPLCKQHGVVWVTNCVRAISLQRSILQAAVAENLVESLVRLCSGFAKIKGKP